MKKRALFCEESSWRHFPVRRRMLMQDSAEAKGLPPDPSSDGEATIMERLWNAHGGWDAASSPAIVAHEHFVQERFQRMAMIIVDVWDTHWCKTAAMRIERLLIPQLNRALRQARKHDMLVIHAPTDIVRFLERNGNVNVKRMRQNARRYAEASNSGASRTADISQSASS
ncbi:hypothetical protein F1559_000245 [Cyanidiococcus yangmingshanensis]|uniref:Uncharacterized protein n=1 Tax=Cyanidiococcus yangmingshanensis TaxID=2690220 RepID=A0A7J7IEV7_9RHOD|nr:hypothetical protein F1559_000245 [Cyanidiococcus yangmingshanensis]